MNNKVWSSNPLERLAAARQLNELEIKELHEDLAKDCPIKPWPFGNATTVNPFLVTLGVSPGNSPESGDHGFFKGKCRQFPTAGEPHPGCVRLTDVSVVGESPTERKGSHHFHREPCACHREVSGEASVAYSESSR